MRQLCNPTTYPRKKKKTYAENALSTDQLDELVLGGAVGIALGIGLEVAQVADVALSVAGGAVGLAEGVDWQCQP